jgi:hypothetical protein
MKTFRLILLVVLASTVMFAGDVARKGTTGADQLLIPVGARSVGTAGAFLSNTHGVEAIYYNPAGLAGATKSEALFGYMNYFADIKVSYLAIGFNIEDLGSFGLTYKNIDFGPIPVTTVESPDGNGSTYSPGFYTIGLTYAKTVTDRVTAGATVKLVNEGILSTSAQGVAFDFGVQYKFVGNLSLGVAIKNIGSNMKYSGTDLTVRTDVPGAAPNRQGTGIYEATVESFGLPSYFEISTAYSYAINNSNSLLIGTTFQNNNAFEDQMKFGTEYKLMNTFALRAGYDMFIQNQDENQYSLNYGGGVEYMMDTFLINIDYAYRSMKDFDGNHVVTLKMSF